MDYDRIQKLISLVEDSAISGLKIEEDNVKIEISKQSESTVVAMPSAPLVGAGAPAAVAAPAPAAAPAPEAASAPADTRDAGLVAITSPMVGTFYSASKPEAPAFVKVGDSVSNGTVVCIVEAMKLFNEIESEVNGTIEKVLIENGQPVEFGQELFLVRAN